MVRTGGAAGADNGVEIDTQSLPTRFNNLTALVPVEAVLGEDETATRIGSALRETLARAE